MPETTPDRQQRIEALYHAALTQRAEARAAFLGEACGSDDALRREVESLLAYAATDSFLQQRALTPAPRLRPGQTLGHYTIVGSLGAGGMGEVYRARDTRLPREVAIKVLPANVSTDPDRRKRLEREAQAVSALNHPHICTLHDIGHQDDLDFLVMELVEGKSLAERLAKGPLPIDEALARGIEIADALSVAHRRGIVHRDLKPGNVMLTKSGAKLLDFGLARFVALDRAVAASIATETSITQHGAIVGTLAYMAPEQLEGREADARTDIFAFGAVLYEMVTGRKAFEVASQASLIGAILRDQPPAMTTIQPLTPPALERIVRTCLEKDPDERWQSAADLGRQLRHVADAVKQVSVESPRSVRNTASVRPWRRTGWITAGLLLGAAVATSIWWQTILPARRAPSGPIRLEMNLAGTDRIGGASSYPLAFSPDGSTLAYVAARPGTQNQIYLRALSDAVARPLAGTEGAVTTFFSPDGQWVGFVADLTLKKAAVSGAGVRVVCECTAVGASWSSDGFIYIGQTNAGIRKVSDSGGTPVEVTRLDTSRGEISHRWPLVVPAEGVLLFTVLKGVSTAAAEIVRYSLTTGDRDILVGGGHSAQFLKPGYLIYTHEGDLLAVPWRPTLRSIRSDVPVSLAEHPLFGSEWASAYALSDEGTLAYVEGGAEGLAHRLVWADRKGAIEPLNLPPRNYQSPAISPDGRRAIVQIGGGGGLWMYTFSSGTFVPFVATGEGEQAPVWTADGAHVIYRATRKGLRNIYWKRIDGTEDEEVLTRKEQFLQTPDSVTADGKWLVFSENTERAGGATLWALRLDGANRPPQLLAKRGYNGRVSPNGQWLAYQANLTQRGEIYVQPFPGPGALVPVSTEGGMDARWSRDGHELFYKKGEQMMAVDVTLAPFSIGRPHVLYTGRYRNDGGVGRLYDVAADGRFLYPQPVYADPPMNRIQIVLNWADEVRKAVGK